jgi:hypothetical protein
MALYTIQAMLVSRNVINFQDSRLERYSDIQAARTIIKILIKIMAITDAKWTDDRHQVITLEAQH